MLEVLRKETRPRQARHTKPTTIRDRQLSLPRANRAVGRATLLDKEADDDAFLRVVEGTRTRVSVRLSPFCLMPNHRHLILWPKEDGDLPEYTRLLTVTHTARWHKSRGTAGTGAIYQG